MNDVASKVWDIWRKDVTDVVRLADCVAVRSALAS